MEQRTIFRDATTGEFISELEARANPEGSVAEVVDTTDRDMLDRIHDLAMAALEDTLDAGDVGVEDVSALTPDQLIIWRVLELSA